MVNLGHACHCGLCVIMESSKRFAITGLVEGRGWVSGLEGERDSAAVGRSWNFTPTALEDPGYSQPGH